MGDDRRRSARHLLGATAEVHIGTQTVMGVIHDVSKHGMKLVLPSDVQAKVGDLIWLLAETVAPFAITGTIRRMGEDGTGVEFEEVLEGDALGRVESLPLVEAEFDDDASTDLTLSDSDS